ncbi:MAG TPA: T9SS type A sorting domain-containing protein [Parafilimonas sp.]|nr:T9SS type A sorting domain-containing protein [Parafilimonas sp.]
MKIFLLLNTLLLAAGSITFSQQCPQAGLKIQTPVCDSPKNLIAKAACEALHIKWKGNKDQAYIVKANYIDPATSQLVEAEAAKQSCDNNGNCSATIRIKEGATVNWSVEAVCSINGATLYSAETKGEATFIPYCNSIADNINKENTDKAIRVYPNPTTGYLTVEYYSKTAGNIEFKIYDVSGKMVYKQSGSSVKTNNRYQLDLRGFAAGVYTLKLTHGTAVSQVKVILSGD